VPIEIDSARIVHALSAVALGFVCLSFVGDCLSHGFRLLEPDQPSWLRRFFLLFSLEAERNLSVLFCVFLHLAAAASFGLIARIGALQRERDRLYWTSLSVLFIGTAVDEAWAIHERLTGPVGRLLDLSHGNAGALYFAWVVPGAVVVLGLAFVYWRFLQRQGATGRMMMLAAAIFVGGALGMEMVGGWYTERYGRDFTYYAIATVEEALEMAGMILLIRTLLKHVAAIQRGRALAFTFS
jgi:hypothetical protein